MANTRTSGAPHGAPTDADDRLWGLAEDLTWILFHFARGVTKLEPLGSTGILAGPSRVLDTILRTATNQGLFFTFSETYNFFDPKKNPPPQTFF